eukprot:15844-Pelagococcus_subviridis.AAC.8
MTYRSRSVARSVDGEENAESSARANAASVPGGGMRKQSEDAAETSRLSDAYASDNQEILEEAGSDYEPAEEEVIEYARWLGIAAKEDATMLWIAREGLAAPLPEGWKPCRTGDGQVYYFNFDTGASSWDHPMDEAFRAKVEEARASATTATRKDASECTTSTDTSADVDVSARRRSAGGSGTCSARSSVTSLKCASPAPPSRGRSPSPSPRRVGGV